MRTHDHVVISLPELAWALGLDDRPLRLWVEQDQEPQYVHILLEGDDDGDGFDRSGQTYVEARSLKAPSENGPAAAVVLSDGERTETVVVSTIDRGIHGAYEGDGRLTRVMVRLCQNSEAARAWLRAEDWDEPSIEATARDAE